MLKTLNLYDLHCGACYLYNKFNCRFGRQLFTEEREGMPELSTLKNTKYNVTEYTTAGDW
jgi:hypothetical protein